MTNISRCTVVGGGAAGLWTALAAADLGMEVTVVDAGRAGGGASAGNAGWICPAQAGPLPERGLIGHGVRDFFKHDSAVAVAPSALPRLAPWLLRFARFCNDEAYRAGVRALSALGYPSFDLIKQRGLDEYCDKTGMLAVSQDPAVVAGFAAKIAPLAEYGQAAPGPVLQGEDARILEPTLPDEYAAMLVADHWQIDPAQFMEALIGKVRDAGVHLVENTTVQGFDLRQGRVVSLSTSSGTVSGDVFVLASGVSTATLARQFGVRLPIVGAKGYSIDVTPAEQPRQAILALDSHLAIAPMGDRLRIAGVMEFSSDPHRVYESRARSMTRAVRPLVRAWTDQAPSWVGLRSITPDGMPLIGRLRGGLNVYVASAYSMLGMTISPAAGELLAHQIATGEDPAGGPFSVDRFTSQGLRKRFGLRA